MPLLSPVELGEEIVNWYSCIISRDVEQAKILKGEIETKIISMQEDDKMLSFYQLVALRHDMMMEAYLTNDSEWPTLNQVRSSADDYLHFMYYFVSGQSEFIKGRFKSAIRSYKIAEQLIVNVKDMVEKAEFYQRLGFSYYLIDQLTFSAAYIEQSLEIFEKNSNYKEREINSKMVMAAIYTELHQFDSAEVIYDEILESSLHYPFTHGLVLRNMGLNRVTQKKFQEAITFFEKALKVKELERSTIGVKARFNLAHTQLKLGMDLVDFERIETEVKAHNLTEYRARSKVSRGLYLDKDDRLVDQGIQQLKENELFFEGSEVAKEAADFYEKEGNLERALKYMKVSDEMNRHQTKLGVDQS